MSADTFFKYTAKGSSKDLVEFVKNHFSDYELDTGTFGIDYPETLSFDFYVLGSDSIVGYSLSAEEVIEDIIYYNSTEISILILIVTRRGYVNKHVYEDIFEAMVEQYPNLEFDYANVDDTIF